MNSACVVLQPPAQLTGTQSQSLRQEVSNAIKAGAKVVLIDFQDTLFVDSSGLSALVTSLKLARQQQRRIVLCSLPEPVKMLLDITDMTRVFEIFPDRATFNQQEISAE